MGAAMRSSLLSTALPAVLLVLLHLILFVVPAAARGGAGEVIAVDPTDDLVGATALDLGAALAPPLDLDLGYRDFVDLELTLGRRAKEDATVTLVFATDAAPDPGAVHRFRVPADELLRDGEVHAYRVDMGLIVPWRGALRRIEVETDREVRCSALRVGDRPDDAFVSRPTPQHPIAGEKNELGEPVEVAESKHFRLCWSPRSIELGFDPDRQVHGTLRNLEEAWQVISKVMGMRSPHESWEPGRRDGTRTKINVSTWFDGYWAGGEEGEFGRLNITADGLRVDPPTWVIPHELCHVFQMHQTAKLRGDWWESHADYAVERWLGVYAPLFEDELLTQFNPDFAATAHYTTPWGGHYYLCWPIWCYLDENPDGLEGLGAGTSTRLWNASERWDAAAGAGDGADALGELWERVGLLTSTSRADLCGLWARRNARWDYANAAALRERVGWALSIEPRRRMIHTPLVPSEGRDGRWRPPFEKAPQQFAYAVHQLEIEAGARRVAVEVEALPSFDREEGLRTSLVVEASDGTTRTSEMVASGRTSIRLEKDDRACYLVVAATPAQYLFVNHDDLARPYGDDAARRRFPYEVELDGARPAPAPKPAYDAAALRPHPNGGGLVADSASVAATAFVGPDALVLDRARVEGTARIEGRAVVRDDAVVADAAIVSDLALVREGARVAGDARVRDFAVVEGTGTVVDGRAQVRHHAKVTGGARVTDGAVVRGCANVFAGLDDAVVGGHAIVEGDANIGRGAGSGVHTGYQPWSLMPARWIDARTSPEALLAAWTFDAAGSFGAPDACGALDAVVRGGARLDAVDERGALVLDGERDACAVLDPSVLDLEGAWTIRCVARAGSKGSVLLAARAGDDRSLRLDLREQRGRPAFELRVGAESLRLAGSDAVGADIWTELVVTCADGTIELVVDGETVDSTAATLEPADLYGGEFEDEVEILLGAQPGGRARFEGAVDELEVLRRASRTAASAR